MKKTKNLFFRKNKIQSAIVMLCLSLLMTSNTAKAQWLQLGQNVYNDSDSYEAVSLNADATVLAIGVPQNGASISNGYVRIYRKINNEWIQIGEDLVGEANGDAFGVSISLNGDGSIVAIGASGNDGNYVGSGHVRIFQNINDVWTQIGSDIDGGIGSSEINGIQLGDHSGNSVSLSEDGSIVAIGAPFSGDNGFNSGKVKIYQNINGAWTLLGNQLLGASEDDLFGVAVSLSADGTLVAIGAHYNETNGVNSGQVKVYEYNNNNNNNNNTNWTQVGQAINGEMAELSGGNISLAADGNVLAIGTLYSKYARVYRNTNNVWTQIGEDILQYSYEGRVEVSLNADGTYLVTGMPRANSNQGISKVFKNVNDSWVQIDQQISGSQTADYFGTDVDISADGSVIALAGFGTMPNGLTAGLVQTYENGTVLGVIEFSNLTAIIHPNPTHGMININAEYQINSVDVYSMQGYKVKESRNTSQIDLSQLTSGIYLLKVVAQSRITYKKIIVK